MMTTTAVRTPETTADTTPYADPEATVPSEPTASSDIPLIELTRPRSTAYAQ